MAEMSDVRCDDCGAVFPMIVGETEREDDRAWHPGCACPMCGSHKFVPVVKTAGAEPKPIAKWKVDRRVGIAAGIIAAVFLIVGFALHFSAKPHRRGGLKAVYMCSDCGERFVARITGRIPKKCPECKSVAGYRAFQCLNCYKVYPWKAKDLASHPPTCPTCKSTASRILSDLSEIREKPKISEETPEEAEDDPNESE
jgi:DNA-directed RNA polymerase subunit RPC12/RpoP